MPITARLSRAFYEKFGDDIVNELVEWLNQVDLAYRSELREQNELNFARFEAKLEQRLAEFKAEIKADMVTKAEFAELRAELKQGFAAITAEFGDVRKEIHSGKMEMVKLVILFWAATGLVGLLIRYAVTP